MNPHPFPELLTVMRRIEERNALQTDHRALGNSCRSDVR